MATILVVVVVGSTILGAALVLSAVSGWALLAEYHDRQED